MTASDVARHLNARPYRSGWIARCPAHKDHSPSLSISEGREGRTLLRCWAGCTTEAVCTSAGITLRDLFQKPSTLRPQTPRVDLGDLRSRLTPRERVLDVTVIQATPQTIDAACARALALAAENQEIVQVVFTKGIHEHRKN